VDVFEDGFGRVSVGCFGLVVEEKRRWDERGGGNEESEEG